MLPTGGHIAHPLSRPSLRRSLQCDNCAVPAAGTLPPALANLTAVTTINLQGNELRGTLPLEWGAPGALQALQNL